MTNKKKKRGRQSWVSKGLNAVGIAIGFARPIEVVINQGFSLAALQNILAGLTFNLSAGSFNLDVCLRMYAPVGAAVGYGVLKSYLMKKFPIRG